MTRALYLSQRAMSRYRPKSPAILQKERYLQPHVSGAAEEMQNVSMQIILVNDYGFRNLAALRVIKHHESPGNNTGAAGSKRQQYPNIRQRF